MKKIPIDKVEVGMLLADNVKSSQGQLLMTSGMEITTKHLQIMKTWGVKNIAIEGAEDEAETPTYTAEQLATSQEDLKPLFKFVPLEHPLIQYLFDYSAKSQASKLATNSK